jgi:hypothetical protein
VPIARYFIFVGSTLAALLFIPGWLLPNAQRRSLISPSAGIGRFSGSSRLQMAGESHSGHQSVTITPPVVMDPPPIQWSIPLASDKAPDQSSLAATALLKPDTQPAHQPTPQSKFRVARTARSRRAARRPIAHRRTAMDGDCCPFGWVDSGQTSSHDMPPKRAASSSPSE